MSSAIAKVLRVFAVRSLQSVRQSETQIEVDFPRGAHRPRRQRQESESGSGMERLPVCDGLCSSLQSLNGCTENRE